MKKLFLIFYLIMALGAFAQVPNYTVYVDFGPNDVTNGNSTPSPDANGNFWNNATVANTTASAVNFVNQSNVATGISMTVTSNFSGTNGLLNGGLKTPDAALIGDFAIATATQDFFYNDVYTTGGLQFSGLNPNKEYKFLIFASRSNAEVRKTEYVISGSNVYTGVLQTSGQATVLTNTNTILTSDAVTPNASGIISMTVKVNAGSFSFINCLKIQEFDKVVLPPVDERVTIAADDANFLYMGRVDFTSPQKALFAYANCAVKTKFQGTSVSMLLNQYPGTSFAENSFYAIVDGGIPLKIVATQATSEYLIANNLADATHTLEIIKITEATCGQCEFLGLKLDKGKSTEAPDALPLLKLEYYGASSTGGYGIEGGARPASDNSYKADPAVCARQLNAQLNVVSMSGYGMAVGWTGVINSFWNKTIPFTATPAPANNSWNFANYQPDVVVIELGTNDYNAPGGLKTTLTVDQYKSTYHTFIDNLRAQYPTAKIICTNSYMLPDPGYGIISNAVHSTVNEENAAGDYRVYYFGFDKMIGGGYNGHPGVTDGTNNGIATANFISSIVLPHNGSTDVTTPLINSLAVNNMTDKTADATVNADENGMAYFAVVLATSATPNAATIIAGSGADIISSGNSAVIANSSLSYGLSSLAPQTNYKLATVVTDATGNISSVSTALFTTSIATSLTKGSQRSLQVALNQNYLDVYLNGSVNSAQLTVFSNDGVQLYSAPIVEQKSTLDISQFGYHGLIIIKVIAGSEVAILKSVIK